LPSFQPKLTVLKQAFFLDKFYKTIQHNNVCKPHLSFQSLRTEEVVINGKEKEEEKEEVIGK